ncbi:RING-type E3 ubiquitin transferase [Malassezia equina]|uniref:RING-type E3 ubiquitin transferase n=1 Tax=Malassezia equina TaxID=1381935 RepID=A0AAF0IZZ0_9BASI|nr:RING-type E3 ubiquitin transferase [Malassezia equina]
MGPHVLHALDPLTHRFLIHSLTNDEHASSELEDTNEQSLTPSPRASPSVESAPSLQDIRRREEARHRRAMRQSLLARRRIYQRHLYAKHVASNRYTKYKPYPGPTGFRRNAAYARLLATFLQRELQVWPHLDVPFLSYYIPAMLSYVDITSDAMLERLTEWVGDADDARHLAHEMELFVRSGLGSLGLDQYDRNPWLQYDNVAST